MLRMWGQLPWGTNITPNYVETKTHRSFPLLSKPKIIINRDLCSHRNLLILLRNIKYSSKMNSLEWNSLSAFQNKTEIDMVKRTFEIILHTTHDLEPLFQLVITTKDRLSMNKWEPLLKENCPGYATILCKLEKSRSTDILQPGAEVLLLCCYLWSTFPNALIDQCNIILRSI
jgi:hypothetical protein